MRVGRAVGLAAGSFATLLTAEVVAVATRRYLPTRPPMEIGGTFGRAEHPSLSFAVLGDSTAAGVGAISPDRAYPTLLAERLAATGRRVELSCFGVSGARVADALGLQVPGAEALRPHVIFVCIGANDVIRLTPAGRFARANAELLDRLLATGASVVASGVPDMRALAFPQPLRAYAGARGRRLSGIIERQATARGVRVVPLAELTWPLFADDPARAYGDGDGLHPGPEGYAAWAEVIAPTLLEAVPAVGPADG